MKNGHMENVFNSMISDISYLKLAYYGITKKDNYLWNNYLFYNLKIIYSYWHMYFFFI